MREVFVLLAGGAPLHILLDPLLCAQPIEALQYLPGGLVSPWVAQQSVMVCVHYSPLELIDGRDKYSTVLCDP